MFIEKNKVSCKNSKMKENICCAGEIEDEEWNFSKIIWNIYKEALICIKL